MLNVRNSTISVLVTLLIRILAVVMSAVGVPMLSGYLMLFLEKVMQNRLGLAFLGLILQIMQGKAYFCG